MISIVVPTRGRASLLRLLESVAELRARNLEGGRSHLDLEVIVAVDTSCDSLENVRAFLSSASFAPELIASGGRGVNLARNRGAEVSRGEIVWFLDDDVELCESSRLTDLRAAFDDQSLVAAGGEYVSGLQAGWAERGYNALGSMWRASAGRENREFLLGGTLAVRRTAWASVGGFDEAIEYGGAETSFVLRLHQLDGKVLFLPELDVIHWPGARGIFSWWKVASRQALRRRDTAAALPSFGDRLIRSLLYLSKQSAATSLCLILFGVPFLLASVVSRVLPFRSGH